MSAVPVLEPIEHLQRRPASDVKKVGWRGMMKAVERDGTLVVTNHNEAQAVILSPQAYAAIQAALQGSADPGEAALDALRRRFDERLAALDAADAGDRLRGLMAGPAELGGEVRAGESH